MNNIKNQNLSKWLELIFNIENVKIISLHLSVCKQNEIIISIKICNDHIESQGLDQKIEEVIVVFDPVIISNPRQAKQKHSSVLELVRYTQVSTTIQNMLKFNDLLFEKEADLQDSSVVSTICMIIDTIVLNSDLDKEDILNNKYPFSTEYSEDDFVS
ncbi:MAG: hypothetical protein NTX85_03370 [Candidatus Nomurabacteria bacterium]|nr:hypothetical protein [Candidatus Nomurabacteria bacterium]